MHLRGVHFPASYVSLTECRRVLPLSRHILQRELQVFVFEKSEDGPALDARARKPPTSPTSQQFYRPWCHLGLGCYGSRWRWRWHHTHPKAMIYVLESKLPGFPNITGDALYQPNRIRIYIPIIKDSRHGKVGWVYPQYRELILDRSWHIWIQRAGWLRWHNASGWWLFWWLV